MIEDKLLSANKRYAATFDIVGLAPEPTLGLALVTCMDVRIDPLAVFGLSAGEVNVIRNAGGRVTDDVVRSLIFATLYLGVTQVLVVHHTRCKLLQATDDEVRDRLKQANLDDPDFELLTVSEQPEALAADVGRITRNGSLPRPLSVEGWVYDVDTGLIKREL